uniref:Uncharacterized protein n=1 Tax=Sexangularia sp. CB-2014 TaxID=1486929 RepID=A0A7S1YGS2_9EUKA|mmetsp:Transcript_5993/g.19556  ORF Transcript_5993/g.19556 Transcript_5993/m.19556 type:complete len:409 (+) Transcript_5993:3-1229(+)
MLTDQWRVRLVRARNRDRSSAKQELLDELPADDRLTVEGRRLRAELLHGANKQGSAEIDSLLRQLRTFPAPVLSFIQYRKAVLIKKDRRMLDSHRAALDLVQAASKDLDRFYGQVAEHVQLNTILSTTLHGKLFKWLQPPSHGSNRRLSATCMRYGWAVLRAKRGADLNDSVATLMQTELERRLHASTGPSAARDLLEFRILCAWPITLSSFQADWLSEFFERASPRDLVCVLLRLDSDSADGIVNTITDERRKADSIEELALRRRALDACWVDKARSGERLLLALIVNVQLSTLASDGIPDGVGSIWTGTVEDVLTRAAAAVADPPGRCHVLVGVDPVHWDMRLHQPTNAGGNFVVTSIPARAIKCTFDLDRLVAKDNMTALLEQGATSMIPLSRRREALQRGRIPR